MAKHRVLPLEALIIMATTTTAPHTPINTKQLPDIRSTSPYNTWEIMTRALNITHLCVKILHRVNTMRNVREMGSVGAVRLPSVPAGMWMTPCRVASLLTPKHAPLPLLLATKSRPPSYYYHLITFLSQQLV